MTIFICDLCDQRGTYDPSLSDSDQPSEEVCTPCQNGQGLAEFYDDEMFVGRQRIPAPGQVFPAEWVRAGITYPLEDSDRMTAVYRT